MLLMFISKAWSPRFNLTWANGRRTVDCLEGGCLNAQDISNRMRHRALQGYGMQVFKYVTLFTTQVFKYIVLCLQFRLVCNYASLFTTQFCKNSILFTV